MSFSKRLSRLGPLPPVSRESSGGAQAEGSPGSEGRQDTLSALQQKMDSILGRPRRHDHPTPPLPNHDPSATTLPFVEQETEQGPLYQRYETQGLSARVGRIELRGALRAEAELLSLLALDPRLSGCDPARAVYFDTETTGLGGAGTVAFLVGLGWFDEEGRFVLEQLLLRDPSGEEALLGRLRELFAGASMLVSFNGKSFDAPLLRARCVMNRQEALPEPPHLDLLHVGKRIHKARLGRCRLIDLEAEVLGWERGEDDIPGAEIAPRYAHFLRTGDEEALRAVVDHNAWDVLSMAALVALYGEAQHDLESSDLLGVGRTLTRAKAFERAEDAMNRALRAGQGVEALEARARLYKARGDKARALADFESLSRQVDDDSIRLELVKLFEHHQKDFERALSVLEEGTGEDPEQLDRRRARLERRAEKSRKR